MSLKKSHCCTARARSARAHRLRQEAGGRTAAAQTDAAAEPQAQQEADIKQREEELNCRQQELA